MSSFIFYKNNSALIEKLKMILKKKLIPFYLYQDHESSELEHENLQIFQEIFKSHVEQVVLNVRLQLNRYNSKNLIDQFEEDYKKSLEEGVFDIRQKWSFSELDKFYSPVISLLESYIKALTNDTVLIEEQNCKLEILENIIYDTPSIVEDRIQEGAKVPHKESEVQWCVEKILKYSFPDTVREQPESQVLKFYRPDFSIKSIQTLIEYKFAADKQEFKKSIGELFEDSIAYEPNLKWRHFYSIVYATDHFYTQKQVDSQLEMLSNFPDNWKVKVVFGKGGRRKRSKKNGA